MTQIKSLRRARGLTQQDIATRLGITRGAYANIENGKREPDFSALFSLADFYDVSIDYLIGHEKKPTVKDSEPSKKEILYRAYLAAAPGTQAAVCKLLDLPSESVTENLA